MKTQFEQLQESIAKVGSGIEEFKGKYDGKFDKLIKDVEIELEAASRRIDELESRTSKPGVKSRDKAFDRFSEYLKTNDLSKLESKDFSIVGGASTGSGTVPTIIANAILDKAKEVSPLIDEVLRTNANSMDYKRIVNRKGLTSGWVSETGNRAATATPGFRTIAPTGGELYCYPKATSWIVQDALFNLAALLISDTGEEFGVQLVNAILFGTGVSMPTGMLNTAPVTTSDDNDVRNADTLRYVTGLGSPNELDGDLLITALFDLSPTYRRNAIWTMNSVTLAACRKLKGLDGHYLWQPSLGVGVDSTDGTLLGKRVVIAEQLQNVGAGAGNFSILVGDFKRGYELTAVGGFQVTRDDNITTPGFIKWYARQRFLGRLIDNNAIRAIRT